jgi:alpha-beta hydrolase superfamily lysophospholipase
VSSWEDEVEARSACPVHRRVIASDDAFERGSLGTLPFDVPALAPTERPTLLLHGHDDVVTPVADALSAYAGASVRARVVDGGRHDVLNDATHRAVAATLVLWLESLKLGPELPEIVSAEGIA